NLDAGSGLVRAAEPGLRSTEAPTARRPFLVEINAGVVDGRLRVEWAYSRELHRPETVRRAADRMLDVLRELIERSATARPALVPQDFPLLDLTRAHVDLLLDRVPELEDAYPLTPLQQGMLFHSLDDAGSGAYFDQLTFDLE